MKKCLLTLLLVVSIQCYSFAQADFFEPGYVIVRGDSLKGFIERTDETKLSVAVNFKENSSSAVRHYAVGELEGFGFPKDGLHFAPVPAQIRSISATETTTRYAKKLVTGYTSLYKLQLPRTEQAQEYLKDNEHVYVLKKDTTFYTLAQYEVLTDNGYRVDKRYVGLLISLLNDCPTIAPASLHKVSFKDAALAPLISKYNSCKDPASANIAHTYKAKAMVKWGPEAGYATVYAPNKDAFLTDKDAFLGGNGYWAGISWDIVAPNVSRRFSTKLGLNYLNIRYDYLSRTRNGYSVKPYEVKEQRHMLRLPIGTQYNFNNAPGKKISPFVNFGLTAQFSANSDFKQKDMVPFLHIGAGAYVWQYKVMAMVENLGFRPDNEKVISLGVGYTFKSKEK
ncbi:hypothetical protein [Rufibacter psychrotolerans]|uniref:hypothetical protein n=1 Tax=Rufibacter psychrotolerans TaxID=2812556 RepID=UPI001967A655|nr:hypothetical protein [Rufibacter sp. SYSU D00308]